MSTAFANELVEEAVGHAFVKLNVSDIDWQNASPVAVKDREGLSASAVRVPYNFKLPSSGLYHQAGDIIVRTSVPGHGQTPAIQALTQEEFNRGYSGVVRELPYANFAKGVEYRNAAKDTHAEVTFR